MYEIAGIITFWVLRIGLIVFLIFFIVSFNNFRQSVTRTVKTSKDTWTRRPLTMVEAAKEIPWYGLAIFVLALLLVVLSWITLFLF